MKKVSTKYEITSFHLAERTFQYNDKCNALWSIWAIPRESQIRCNNNNTVISLLKILFF